LEAGELEALEAHDQRADVGVDQLVWVSGVLGESAQLGDRRPVLLERVRPPDRDLATVERPGEHRRVPEPPCHRDRFGAEGETPRAARVAAHLQGSGGEPSHHPCAEFAVVRRERPDRLLDQGDDVRVAAHHGPDESAAVSERGPSEPLA
jgi:hypothetical protein